MNSIFQKVDCVHCKLSGGCLPQGQSLAEIKRLEAVIKPKRTISQDGYLFRQEDLCSSLFIVKSGSFRSIIWDINGNEQTIGFHLPGELLGLDALRQGGRYHCTVIALETASVCELPFTSFNDLCAKTPKLRAQFLRLVGAEIVSDQMSIVLLGNRSAYVKVAAFLLALSGRYSALGYSGTEFNLTMPRHIIANFLGLTIETLSRQLGSLSKSGAITIKNRRVRINNLNMLSCIVVPGSAIRTACANY